MTAFNPKRLQQTRLPCSEHELSPHSTHSPPSPLLPARHGYVAGAAEKKKETRRCGRATVSSDRNWARSPASPRGRTESEEIEEAPPSPSPRLPPPPPPRRRFPLRCVAPALGRLTCSFLLQKVVGAPQPHYSFCPVNPPPAVQPTRAEVPRCPRDGHLVLITVPPPRNRPAIEDDELTETMLFSLLPRTFSTALPIPLPLPNPPPPTPRAFNKMGGW